MDERTCISCNISIVHRGPRAIYCSQQCRDWRRFHPSEPLNRAAHLCRYCAAPLDQRKLDLRFCDLRCQARGLKGAAQIPDVRACRHCGSEFDVDHGHRVYCSAQCSSDATLPQWREANRDRIRERMREYRQRTGKGTEAVHRYQARKRAGEPEQFSNREIYDRDGWVCQICRHPVDPGVVWPDPLSPSLDHIIPVSKEGRHVRVNVQLAHLTCNISKSDKELTDALGSRLRKRVSDARVACPGVDDGVPRAT